MTAALGQSGFGSMTPQQIYENFMNAKGPGELLQSRDHLAKVMNTYQDRARQITQLAAAMEEGWTGDASQAAQRSAGPLALAHDEAALQMVHASRLIENQTQAFYDTKNSVVPVPEVPEAPSWIDNLITAGSAGSNYANKVAANMEAAQTNVNAMNAWTTTSSDHGAQMPVAYGSIDPGALNVNMSSSSTPSVGGDAAIPGGGTGNGFSRGGGGGSGAGSGNGSRGPGDATLGNSGFTGDQQQSTTADRYLGPGGGLGPVGGRGGPAPGGPGANGAGIDWPPYGSFSGSLEPDDQARNGSGRGSGAPGPGSGRRGAAGRLHGGGGIGGGAGERGLGAGNRIGAGPGGGPAAEPAGRPGTAGSTGRPGAGAMAPGAAGKREKGEEDAEHQRKYVQDDDEPFQLAEPGETLVDPRTGLPVAPPVIGQ